MEKELEHRLIELETQVAYQDNTLLKMNALVEAHQKQLYHLETRFALLQERFQLLQDGQDTSPIPNEVPPHY